MAYFLERNMLFTILENVERVIFFTEIINERIKELAEGKGKEIPERPDVESEAFLRVPVLDEYLEAIIKQGYWEGVAFVHGFEGAEESEVFDAAVVNNQDKNKEIKISIKDLYVDSDDLLSLESELGIFVTGSTEKKLKPELKPRAEKTYLNIIGALIEILTGESPGVPRHPNFPSQAKLIEHLCEFEVEGLSKSNLEKKLAEAKKSLHSSF